MARKQLEIPYYEGKTDLPIGPDHPWLAPLAGCSDLPFRMLCREQGAAVCVTEMISAKGLFYKGSKTGELLSSAIGDEPLVVQLFGGEKESIGEAVRVLRQHGYLNLDFNMGCSVKKVFRQKAGAWLLGEPETALELAKTIIYEAKHGGEQKQARVGFKLRLGIRPGMEILPDLALRLEDAGADWLTLHPRYANQGFTGSADWEKLRRLAEKLTIPLIASGDLLNAKAGLTCMEETGVSGVMYGRGALRDPAIFHHHHELRAGRPYKESDQKDIVGLLLRHLYFSYHYGADRRAFTKLRSIVPRYVRLFRGSQDLRHKLSLCEDWDSLKNLILSIKEMGE